MIEKNDLVFVSDNSIDKIPVVSSTSFNISGRVDTTNGSGSTSASHSLGETPFFVAQFSVDNLRWFPIGYVDNITYGPLAWTSVDAYTTGTTIVFRGSTAGGAKTVYVRYDLFLKEVS